MKEILTRTECTAMKGIAILGIMLHNYCHWLKGITRENEYTWSQWKNDQLWAAISQPDELLPMHLVSYFGHYGVPVFLFLSGFGRVMKYEKESAQEDLITQIVNWRSSTSGVDWNEELTNMITFQKGYSACSRCLTTMDEMLDRLINSTGVVGR